MSAVDPWSRRRFLAGASATALGLGALVSSCDTSAATPVAAPGGRRVVLEADASGAGRYVYLPVDVPRGVGRLDVRSVASEPSATLGLGLFDQRGAGYQSPGFRGIYGSERSAFTLSATDASEAFLPGPIGAGRWTVVVPVFHAPSGTRVRVTVTMTDAGTGTGASPIAGAGPALGVVRGGPAWFKGDLHCHTPASSDAWASRSALDPADWARALRARGMDFAAMTDHNVVTQNRNLAVAAGDEEVLLLPGEEMTNYFHGHATVSGLHVGDWLDWRQSPEGASSATAAPTADGSPARIRDFLAAARATGGYIAAAHPSAAGLGWQFTPELLADPASRPDGWEVWTGPFGHDDEVSLRTWDGFLRRGLRLWANGGSDLHGIHNDGGFGVGTPTTVVWAQELSSAGIVAALRSGRSYVTRRPDRVEVELRARAADQDVGVGGTLHGRPGDVVEVTATLRRATGMHLTLLTGDGSISTYPITSDDQTFLAALPVPRRGGYVRAEVRGSVPGDRHSPSASETDMEAFTNPIFLAVGDPTDRPDDAGAGTAPGPPAW